MYTHLKQVLCNILYVLLDCSQHQKRHLQTIQLGFQFFPIQIGQRDPGGSQNRLGHLLPRFVISGRLELIFEAYICGERDCDPHSQIAEYFVIEAKTTTRSIFLRLCQYSSPTTPTPSSTTAKENT